MATFEIDLGDFIKGINKSVDEIKDAIEKGTENGLKVSANEIKKHEQRLIEQRTGNGEYMPTGNLKRSVTIMPIEWSPYGASISILPTAKYAIYAEKGTGIFVEGGRQGGWCYPIGNGEYRFTYGMPPKLFVQHTYEFYEKKVSEIIRENIYRLL